MSIHKDKERGTWYFSIRVNGRQIMRRGFKTKKEATTAERLFVIENSNKPFNADMSFIDVASHFFTVYKANNKFSSYRTAESVYRLYIYPFFKSYQINKIANKDIVNFHLHIKKYNFSKKYNDKIHGVLVSILKHGIMYYGLSQNVAQNVGRPKTKKAKPEITFWEKDEFDKFMESVDDEMYKVLFNLLYYSGMRSGEARALKPSDLSLEFKSISISKTLQRSEDGGEIETEPKTKNSSRIVLIDGELTNLLKTYLINRDDSKEFLFYSDKNDYLPYTTMNREFSKYLKKSGAKKITVHDLRHSYASLLINNGADPFLIAEMLGHANVTQVNETYGHLYPSRKIELIKKLESIKCYQNVITEEKTQKNR